MWLRNVGFDGPASGLYISEDQAGVVDVDLLKCDIESWGKHKA